MLSRLATFAACLLAGAALGWWLAGPRGLEFGLAAGAIATFVLETLRGMRVLRWLQRGAEPRLVPPVGGLWGDALDRMRRAVSARDRQAAEARQRLEDFIEAIRGSPIGVVLLDTAARIEWCNETAAVQFGLDPHRDVQQPVAHLVRDPDFAAFLAARDFTRELVLASPHSTPSRPLRVALRLHRYGEGRLLLLSRDVTALEQAEAMRRDFVANVSHEIRTPLTVLAGFIETLQSIELPTEERARYLQLMEQQSDRMQTLVSDLLMLSRLEGSPLPGAGAWTSVAALLAQCEQEARALSVALGKGLDLRFDPAPAAFIAGAQAELQSALSNLVSNAVRYTPAAGTVEVSARVVSGGALEFRVRDTGPGIAPEHLPRITERFYRVDRSRSRDTGGTGLGLAIVKHVVQRHGGVLNIESFPGAGSTFAIQFPSQRVRLEGLSSPSAERPARESAAG